MPENITFREHLLGSVNDFTDSCSMGPLVTPAVLVELIVVLARCREEGTQLFPEVYLCNNVDDMLKLIPDNGILHIGTTKVTDNAIKEILKKCAPLAIDGWCVFIDGKGTQLNYGLFRDSLNPTAIPIEQTLLVGGSDDEEIKVVRIHQTAEDCVEIRNYKGEVKNIFLSHRKSSAPAPAKFLNDLVCSITNGVLERDRESVNTYLMKSLRIALRESHGTLIVVCRTQNIPKFLSDGIHLSEPIDIKKLVKESLQDKIISFGLLSQAAILKGMLKCDGIIVFSQDAKLLAYSCFISSKSQSVKPSIGGARRRAYEILCGKLRKGICAAFIQSQDGWSDFRRIP